MMGTLPGKAGPGSRWSPGPRVFGATTDLGMTFRKRIGLRAPAVAGPRACRSALPNPGLRPAGVTQGREITPVGFGSRGE